MIPPVLDPLASIAAMWIVGVIIPGPNFFAAARIAATRGRRAALASVGGIGLGTLIWGISGAFGVHLLFTLAPFLYAALTLAGACYLIVIGARAIVSSLGPARPPVPATGPAFRQGILTSLSNPKSALFVAAIFAAVMPHGATMPMSVGAGLVMATISLLWYGCVVCLLTTAAATAVYARLGRWTERVAGAVFIAFGARLVWDRT